MTYQVLALKWRPAGFDKVVAQEHVTKTLQNAITSDRIANAYLFCGPRGVGKTTTARIFAKSLNCKQGPTATPCNSCVNCIDIAAGHSLDVFEIDGASNRGIDEIRNLRENIRYSPSSSKFKIYIVDEVHMLTTEAFNALLKTLEEPPKHVRFIFATTEPHRVPATILSRCQRFDFKRIPLEEIIKQLNTICIEEKINPDEESLLVIAKKADGSLRDAESLLDQLVSFCGNDIKIQDVLEAFSVVSQDLYFKLTDILIEKDIQKGLKYIDQLISDGYDINEFLLGLVEHLRNLIFSQATNEKELLETSENYRIRYLEECKNFSQEDLLRMIQIVSDTEYKIKRSPNPRIRLEMCVLKLLKLERSVTISDVINQLQDLGGKQNIPTPVTEETKKTTAPVNKTFDQKEERRLEKPDSENQKKNLSYQKTDYSETKPISIREAEPQKEEEMPRTSLSLDLFREKWQDIIENVQKKRLYVSVFLKEGEPVSFDQHTLHIGFNNENGFQLDAVKKSKDLILQAIQEILGETITIKFIKANIELKTNPEILTNNKKKHVQKKIDQRVKRILDVFDGELITFGGYNGKT
jgi:DNA polymerase-3 subunit gamma/tau